MGMLITMLNDEYHHQDLPQSQQIFQVDQHISFSYLDSPEFASPDEVEIRRIIQDH